MRPRVLALGAAGLLLALAAGTTMLLEVRVHTDGAGATCGTPFDTASGRAGWESWYAADLADPRLPARGDALVRTEACPPAVNRRTALAGVLGAAAVIAIGTAALVSARERRQSRDRGSSLRTLGAYVSAAGATLTGAGLVALVVLLANPRATLYLYVDRWVVAVVGLIVLVPAIALAAAGRALMIAATTRVDATDDDHATP